MLKVAAMSNGDLVVAAFLRNFNLTQVQVWCNKIRHAYLVAELFNSVV